MPANLVQKSLLFIALVCFCLPSFALDPKLNWKSLPSDHFIVHFPESYLENAQQVSALAEKIHQRLSPQFNWQPDRPTHIVLNDLIDVANGNASIAPYNLIEVNLFPPRSGKELADFEVWMESLLIHEYSHILQFDKKSGVPGFFRRFFGHQLSFYPSIYQPAWLKEGLATQLETDDKKHIGRRQSSLFRAMMLAELGINKPRIQTSGLQPQPQTQPTPRAKTQFKSLAQVNAHSVQWPLNTEYLYGSFFYHFLEQRYGRQAIFDFVAAYSNNWFPFALNTTSKEVFGQNFATLWQAFELWLPSYLAQEPQDTQQTSGHTETAIQLSHHGAFTGPIGTSGNDIFYLRDDGHQKAAIMQWQADAPPSVLVHVEHNSQFDIHPEAGFVVAQLDYCDPHRLFYDLYLYPHNADAVSPKSPALKQITHCGRYHDVAWHPNGNTLAAITTRKGLSEIHILSVHGELKQVIQSPNADTILSGIDWREDGQSLVSAAHQAQRGQWDIAEYSVKTNRWHWLTNDQAIDSHPQYTRDQSIIFSSDRDGAFKAYQTKPNAHTATVLTPATNLALHPKLTQDNKIVYLGYHSEGFDVYQSSLPPTTLSNGDLTTKTNDRPSALNIKLPQANNPAPYPSSNQAHSNPVEIPKTRPRNKPGAAIKDYSPWSTALQTTWQPIFDYRTDQGALLGIRFSGNDPLRVHHYQWGGFIDTFTEEPGGFFSYQFNNQVSITLTRSQRFLADTSNNLRAIETRDSIEFFYQLPWLALNQQWRLLSGFAIENQQFKNIDIPNLQDSNSQDYVLGSALFFNNSRRYLYGISRTDGRQVYAVLEWVQEADSEFAGAAGIIDWREYITLGRRNVIALRQVLAATEEVDIPFELGDTFTDHYQGVNNVFNRRDFSLRGYESSHLALQGQYLSLSSIEWRFPLLNIEHSFMTPPLGISGVHGLFFFDSGNAWNDSADNSLVNRFINKRSDWHSSVGAEIIINWKLFYNANFSSRLGAVNTFDELGEDKLYASIGLSF